MSETAPVASDLGTGPFRWWWTIIRATDPQIHGQPDQRIITMTDAVDKQDFDTIKRVAHGMKWVSGSYGFHATTTIAGHVRPKSPMTPPFENTSRRWRHTLNVFRSPMSKRCAPFPASPFRQAMPRTK